MESADPVAAVRRFNRFYTRAIGLLDKGYLGTDYTLTEGRVLYEIAKGDGPTAKQVGAITGLDAGYLSRILGRFERDGLVVRERSPSDGRSALLRLTPHGEAVFAPFDRKSAEMVEGLIGGLSSPARRRLTGAMAEVEDLLGAPAPGEIVLRAHRPGDMGWVVERHAVLYGREYGWGEKIEAVTATSSPTSSTIPTRPMPAAGSPSAAANGSAASSWCPTRKAATRPSPACACCCSSLPPAARASAAGW